MAETMACGPDDRATWMSGHAALGHRRLAIIDLPGGRQPVSAAGTANPVGDNPTVGDVLGYATVERHDSDTRNAVGSDSEPGRVPARVAASGLPSKLDPAPCTGGWPLARGRGTRCHLIAAGRAAECGGG